jgi:hypothetical protein
VHWLRPSAATDELHQLDALVLAVSHKQYLDLPVDKLTGMLRKGGLLLDVKGCGTGACDAGCAPAPD